MPELDRDQLLKDYELNATEIANRHYSNLLEVIRETVPEFMIPTGDRAPSLTRPLGFTYGTRVYFLFMQLGPGYAQTVALFKFKNKLDKWAVKHYLSTVGSGVFIQNQTLSYSIQDAVLAAKELWLESQANSDDLQPVGVTKTIN